jgi:hypothetical protein
MIRNISCHCGEIRLEVNADLREVIECNCSTCGKSGYLSWYVPTDSVRLATPNTGMSSYFWRFATEGFHFCNNCGIATHRTWNDRISVNARCIDDVDVFKLETRRVDGKHNIPAGSVPPLSEN